MSAFHGLRTKLALFFLESFSHHNPEKSRPKKFETQMLVTAYKHSRLTHVGLGLWKTPHDHQVLIVHIDDHSIFARSGLKVGMKIDRINNCTFSRSNSTMDQINAILNDAVGELTIYTSAPRLSLLSSTEETSMSVASLTSATSNASDDEDTSCSSDFDENLSLSHEFGFRGSMCAAPNYYEDGSVAPDEEGTSCSSESLTDEFGFRESMCATPHSYEFEDGLMVL